ncbi:glutamine-rich protein 2 [Anguilla anguilla]|uniref:glutamine-rich protein 2 n=1 Tax=Anguilla anguilla TaxID=7936 RepID=UPI0015AC7ECB|nr:glutamine-rich protein 2 [Anguilla anguilla]
MAQRLARLEQRMDALDQLPTTDALLKQTTSGSAQLVRDMWQLMQLRKKTEANHDGIAKAMSVLGDLLDEVRILKDTTNSTFMQMDELQVTQQAVTLQAVKEAMTTMEDLKERMRQMKEAVTRPQNQPSVESEQQEGQQALRWVGALSTQQAALKEELESLQDQLQQLTLALANKDIPNNIQAHLKSLDDELHSLKRKETQEQRGLQTFYDKLAEFRAESDRQNAATERLLDSCRELESRVSHLEQHRVQMQKRKGSGESGEGQLERGVGDEDASLSQAQQKAISQYLSSLLQDLLPTLPTQDWDWPEVLDKLSKDMEHKLDRVELIPLKQELEDGWRKIKARLKEEPDLGANTPAGFRKKLLERVSCISCDKPANILTGMHLVTVRSTSPRPGRSGSTGPHQRRQAWR